MRAADILDPVISQRHLEAILANSPKCPICGVTLQRAITGRQHIEGKGDCCDDCYYGDISDLIEQCPPCSPRFSRR